MPTLVLRDPALVTAIKEKAKAAGCGIYEFLWRAITQYKDPS